MLQCGSDKWLLLVRASAASPAQTFLLIVGNNWILFCCGVESCLDCVKPFRNFPSHFCMYQCLLMAWSSSNCLQSGNRLCCVWHHQNHRQDRHSRGNETVMSVLEEEMNQTDDVLDTCGSWSALRLQSVSGSHLRIGCWTFPLLPNCQIGLNIESISYWQENVQKIKCEMRLLCSYLRF